MPAGGCSVFTDADGYQASLRDMLDLLVPQPREFTARLTWVEFPTLHLLRAQEASPRIAYAAFPPQRVFATFLAREGPPIIYGGGELRYGDIMLHGVGERVHQRTTAATSWGAVSLTPAALQAFARTVGGQELVPPVAGRVLHPRAADRQVLLRLHAQACRIADSNPDRLRNAEVVRGLEQDMIWALVTCLAAQEGKEDRAPRNEQARILARLETMLASRPYQLWTTQHICGAIGVSVHRLRSSCAAVLGMSPGRYQKLRRLKLVRMELMGTEAAAANSAKVLARYGFSDLHRFIAEYWNLYGELPPLPPRKFI